MQEFNEAEAEVIAICVDPVSRNAKIAERLGLQFPVLSDPNLVAIDAFDLRHVEGGFDKDIARPAVFIIDENGKILWRRLTDNWRVRLRPEDLLEVLLSAERR